MIDKSLFALPGIKKMLLLLTGFAVATGMAVLGQAFALSSAINNLWLGGALANQSTWIALFLLSFIGVQAVTYLQDLILDKWAYKQADALRSQLITTVFSKGPELVQNSGTGNVTTQLLEGVEQVENYLRLILQKIVRILIVPLLLLIPVFILDWVSGIAMVIVFPSIIFYMAILGRVAQEKAAAQHRGFTLLSNHFINSLRGIDTLKLFGVSKQHGKNIYAVSEKYRKATIKTLRIATLSSSVLDLFATLSLAAVAILLGLRLLDGSLALFPALTVLVIAPEYFKPIREFASDFHASLDGRNALASIQQMIADYQPSTLGAEDASLLDQSCFSWHEDARLCVDGLGLSYGKFEALRSVSFEATGFMKVGIVGASGAGKSTLIQLLGGFATANKGSISVNGVSMPTSDLRQPGWQKRLALLPQDPYIFHASLRENISFYCPEATEAEIAQAVAAVGLERLVDELDEGLDTKIGQGARALSGGQAQRVVLARMYLDKGREVLLFDEPTAHLDIETEFELKQSMLPLMENRIVFFATHRLHWMHEMDLILVMDGGMIVESGTLEELRAADGHFSSLVQQVGGGDAL